MFYHLATTGLQVHNNSHEFLHLISKIVRIVFCRLSFPLTFTHSFNSQSLCTLSNEWSAFTKRFHHRHRSTVYSFIFSSISFP